MKQDTEWNVVSTSYGPLTLYRLIKKTVLGQTEDQHPFATVYNQELGFYASSQDNMSNPQWYERFNIKVQSLLAVFGVLVVPGGEVILKVHLQVSMLGAALSQESVGKVSLFGVLTRD